MADPSPPNPPITPSEASSGSQSRSSTALRSGRDGKTAKREQVAAACLECRNKKVKVRLKCVWLRFYAAYFFLLQCDAVRPSCGRCTQRKLQCGYDVAEPDTTKLVAARRRNEEMQEQLEGMRELYGYMAERTEEEATRILQMIRAHPDDPFAVLRAIQEADLLLLRSAGAARGGSDQNAPQ